MKLKKMLLIFNPISGTKDFVQYLYPVVDKFTKSGYLVTVYPTQEKLDAYNKVLKLAPRFDCLVSSGGDGTLNEVVDALMALPKKPVFGYIPAGTTNDFAYSIGIPGDILLAAEAVCSGELTPIDIGSFQSEYFTYVAAFGLFTDVSYGTSQNLKNMLGHAAYILEGVKRLANINSYRCTVICDEEEINDDLIFGMITNSQSVGGFTLPIDTERRTGDGKFDVILLKRINSFLELQQVIAALMGGKQSDRFVLRAARHIRVVSETPLDWTLDGEFGGRHYDTEILAHRQAISIMTPRQRDDAPAE